MDTYGVSELNASVLTSILTYFYIKKKPLGEDIMRKLHRLVLMLALFASSFLINAAYATSSPWQGIDETQVRLISSRTALGDQTQLTLGLQFKMNDHWKVYWRSPGDAGTRLQLTGRTARISRTRLWNGPFPNVSAFWVLKH